jgi:uncharacterized protein YbjT (DUF2867 family)
MRVLVTGAGGFVGAHVDAELVREGHLPVDASGEHPISPALVRESRMGIDAIIHMSPSDVRRVLDLAFPTGAKVFILLSTLGAEQPGKPLLEQFGEAERLVRASGLPWVILRPEVIWGPGDVFTNELAHLMRHLPFVPIPRNGPPLAPVFAGDVGRALVMLLSRADLWNQEWTLVGPETMRYGEAVGRVAEGIGLGGRKHLRVPAWSVRLGAALEERIAHRPKLSRGLLDKLVAGGGEDRRVFHPLAMPLRPMTPEALRAYLGERKSPDEQLHAMSATP